MQQTGRSSALEQMIQQQVVRRGIRDERLLDAMRSIPREDFFPADDQADAFDDGAHSIGFGQTISQPYVVALMTERLEIEPQHRVLEIGTGSGYHTAILARLCSEVYTVERIKPLLDVAFDRLHRHGIQNVRFKYADGSLGWSEHAPYDRIVIGAAAPQVPTELLATQLADGGVAVLPVGRIDEQILLRVTRTGGQLQRQPITAVRFVPLVGANGFPEER